MSVLPKYSRAIKALQANATLENLGAYVDKLQSITESIQVSSITIRTKYIIYLQ